MCDLAPAPEPALRTWTGTSGAVDAPVLWGWCSRCRPTWTRRHRGPGGVRAGCALGRFERGMVLTHAATGRPFADEVRARRCSGRSGRRWRPRSPGDVIGLVNATALRPGDTLYAGVPVTYPPIPSFAPEHFGVVRCKDAGKYKQFRRGHRPTSTPRVWCRCSSSDLPRRPRRRCSPPSGRCSSTWCCTGFEHEFGAKSELSHLKLRDRQAYRRGRRRGAWPERRRGAEVLARRARRGAAGPVSRTSGGSTPFRGNNPSLRPRPAARGHGRVKSDGSNAPK